MLIERKACVRHCPQTAGDIKTRHRLFRPCSLTTHVCNSGTNSLVHRPLINDAITIQFFQEHECLRQGEYLLHGTYLVIWEPKAKQELICFPGAKRLFPETEYLFPETEIFFEEPRTN